MNELRRFLFGQVGGVKLKPLCRQCVQNYNSVYPGNEAGSSLFKLLSTRFGVGFRSATQTVCSHLDILSELFSRQCNVIIAQRIRRSYQVLLLYRNLYGDCLLKEKVRSQFTKLRKKPLLTVLSAAAFSWDSHRVSDEEIKRCVKEIDEVNMLLKKSKLYKENPNMTPANSGWEQIVDKPDFKVWRRQLPNSQLYKYRVLGHFKDIPARAFYNTQVDVHYWKDWDAQTMDVHIVDRDDKTGSEVVQWLYKFPYPMHPREYVYVRRCTIYPEKNAMIVTARATKHPKCPPKDGTVRVETYQSQMVITPYTYFDEDGFSYVMTYSDDFQTNFPPTWYNWMASSGVQDFLQRMHRAAMKKKHNRTLDYASSVIESGPPSNLYSDLPVEYLWLE